MRFSTALTLLIATTSRHPRYLSPVASFLLSPSHRRTSVLPSTSSSHHYGTLVGATAFTPRKKNPLAMSSQCRGGATTTTTCSSSSTSLAASTATEETTTAASQPTEVFRKDYIPAPFAIPSLSMDFQIIPNEGTIVTSTLSLQPNERYTGEGGPLVLDGDATSIELLSVVMDGKELVEGVDYTLTSETLTIPPEKVGSTLVTKVKIHPETNTQLSGLYKSSGMYCTQCEAMGFRRITYYLDRPDNMAVFEKVRVEAPKEGYPVLLSNGNLLEKQDVEGDDSRHYAIWSDPYPKPSYLFALVAGDLGSIKDNYVTTSGRDVTLEIFSEKENVNKLDHAMRSLKKSMEWDEQRFGLEYDLDLYNIVAVNDFNMGAMENKGLNVFNTAYVLASPQTATDTDFQNVEGVIGHEYFHNWTGNRVTCRDWFQLTLKEGLTVFRDQEFSGDVGDSKSVNRIGNVRGLRGRQFAEDAGPMKHPIRPESYISMDNFYTATVYTKGSEVIRMYQTLLTPEGFRKGMDLYFERHDGSAVTCDDFLAAMADANNVDLSQFARWYSTPGTPTVTYSSTYTDGTLALTFKQSSLSTEGPLHIPISVGVLDGTTGKEIVATTVLDLKQDEQTFTFENLTSDSVVPSILRDFSAPVKLQATDTSSQESEWSFLAAHDTDGFNKWDAAQKLYTAAVFKTLNNDDTLETTLTLVEEAFGRTLKTAMGTSDNRSITAYALTLPSESTLAEEMTPPIDPVGLHDARGTLKKHMARTFYEDIKTLYDQLTDEINATNKASEEYPIDAASMGRRSLRNVLLDYLTSVKETPEELATASALAMAQFTAANGLTDKMAALGALVSMDTPDRDTALQTFYDDANGDPLVLNKWFSVQALADTPDTLQRVQDLTSHPDFTLANPNRCRSLVGAFSMNESKFHASNGEGYRFLGKMIAQMDKLNPQLSSRVAKGMIGWKRYDEGRATVMKEELKKLKTLEGISDDLFEVVSLGLK